MLSGKCWWKPHLCSFFYKCYIIYITYIVLKKMLHYGCPYSWNIINSAYLRKSDNHSDRSTQKDGDTKERSISWSCTSAAESIHSTTIYERAIKTLEAAFYLKVFLQGRCSYVINFRLVISQATLSSTQFNYIVVSVECTEYLYKYVIV